MAQEEKATHWADIQEQVFRRWCNDELRSRGINLKTLDDFKDGTALCNLMEVISGKSLGGWNQHPRIPISKIENSSIALAFIKNEGIRLENIGGNDIAEGNKRCILGLLWTLILRFEINRGGNDDLLKWVQSKIPQQNITGWTGKDWNSGVAVCALTEAVRKGACPEYATLSPANSLANATLGVNRADEKLGVDKLLLPNELINPKVDALALQTYIAQFRNVKDNLVETMRIKATGEGLRDGIVNKESKFSVLVPGDLNGKLTVLVEGPANNTPVIITKIASGYDVSYTPTVAGVYKVHVLLEGVHIPGSVFTVLVLEEESLGGEGKIRVFFSTTQSTQKGHADVRALTSLLEGKKVHLRPDFEPWHPIDLFDRDDREAVFRKAGTRNLPIVFVDDKYVGDYDILLKLEEQGKLDSILSMKGVKLITNEEHVKRMQNLSQDLGKSKIDSKSPVQPKPAPSQEAKPALSQASVATAPEVAAPKFCAECGAPRGGGKYCSGCGDYELARR